mgnify:CR=1 FL=1
MLYYYISVYFLHILSLYLVSTRRLPPLPQCPPFSFFSLSFLHCCLCSFSFYCCYRAADLNQLRALSAPEADISSIGRDLPKEQLDALSDDQQEKLISMFNETQRLFSGNYNAADVGEGFVVAPQVTIVRDTDAGADSAAAAASAVNGEAGKGATVV